jgi:hypothetical protein
LFQLGAAIGQRGVRRLDHKALGRFQHQGAQAFAPGDCPAQRLGRNAMAAAADLHIGGMLGAIVAHDQRYAGETFKADDADFNAMILGIHRHHRGDPDFQEIGMGDRFGGDFDDLALFQGHGFKIGPEQIPVLQTNFVQKPVADSGACMRF